VKIFPAAQLRELP